MRVATRFAIRVPDPGTRGWEEEWPMSTSGVQLASAASRPVAAPVARKDADGDHDGTRAAASSPAVASSPAAKPAAAIVNGKLDGYT
jgi:hypothetical protein